MAKPLSLPGTGWKLKSTAFAGRVVREQMIPYFMENDYFGGTNAAVDALIARLSGEYRAEEESEGEESLGLWFYLFC